MNLQEFVKESIIQITKGMIEADAELKEFGGAINPKDVVHNQNETGPYGYYAEDSRGQFRRAVEGVTFDVVVTTTEGTETKGGIGIHVGAVGVGSSGKSGKKDSAESRIQFTVPVLIPNSKNT